MTLCQTHKSREVKRNPNNTNNNNDMWTPSHGRAKAGQPARTYIHQLCADTGCSPEDLPVGMNNKNR